MVESEVKIYDSNINLRPAEAEHINPVLNSTFELVEITPHFEKVIDKCDLRFVKKRKFRRVKSAGIF